MEGALIVIGIFTYFALNTKLVFHFNRQQVKKKTQKKIHSQKELSLKNESGCCFKKYIENFEKFSSPPKYKKKPKKRKNKVISEETEK